MPFDVEVNKVLGIEGVYSNNPDDAGGETMWGIAASTARSYGYTGAIKDMPKDLAIAIYKSEFWYGGGCDKIASISDAIACDLFESGVNIGVTTAGRLLQRALNALSVNKLTVDGQVGSATATALQAVYDKRGQDGLNVVRGMFLSLLSYRYITIVESNPSQVEFIYGWELNRVIGAP